MSEPVSWFSQFVSFVEAEAQAAENKIEEVADEIGAVVVQYGEEFLKDIAQVAIGAVLQQAPLAISGAEKFGAAVANVWQTVEAQGKQMAVNDIHAVVQSAYTAVKNVVGGAAVTSAQ